MNETELLARITSVPEIFGGKPSIRGRRLAVEHVLGMLPAGDPVERILQAYPWLEREDIQACLVYARRLVAGPRFLRVPSRRAGRAASWSLRPRSSSRPSRARSFSRPRQCNTLA